MFCMVLKFIDLVSLAPFADNTASDAHLPVLWGYMIYLVYIVKCIVLVPPAPFLAAGQ